MVVVFGVVTLHRTQLLLHCIVQFSAFSTAASFTAVCTETFAADYSLNSQSKTWIWCYCIAQNAIVVALHCAVL